jgi:membrane fusion protein, multidrug efflux system
MPRRIIKGSYFSQAFATRAVLCAALTLLCACNSTGAGESSAVPGAPPDVVVVTLKAQPVTLTQDMPGRTRASLVAEVRPQVRGIIKQQLFTEGGWVKAGQPLYEIDDAVYRAQYQSAEAALLKARAGLKAADLAASRARELVRIDAVSAQENETAVAAEGEAQADVRVAEAAVASSRVNLEYAHVVAPIAGRIGKSSVTRGALVTAEQTTPLATIQLLDPIYVEVSQSSTDWLALTRNIDAGRLRSPGADANVTIVLENGEPYEHKGKLQFAESTVDPATGNLMLRVVVANPKNILLPGMHVRAIVAGGVLDNGILVPQQAIVRDPNGHGRALIVTASGKVEARAVEVSRAIGDQWLLERGLGPGDRLIVEGLHKADPGTIVHAIERTPQSAAVPHAH